MSKTPAYTLKRCFIYKFMGMDNYIALLHILRKPSRNGIKIVLPGKWGMVNMTCSPQDVEVLVTVAL